MHIYTLAKCQSSGDSGEGEKEERGGKKERGGGIQEAKEKGKEGIGTKYQREGNVKQNRQRMQNDKHHIFHAGTTQAGAR